MTPELFASTPDRVILACYFAPRTKQGRLIGERERAGQEKRERRRLSLKAIKRRAEASGRKLPSAEELKVPAEAFQIERPGQPPPPSSFVLLFWQWGRRVGLPDAEILAKLRKA